MFAAVVGIALLAATTLVMTVANIHAQGIEYGRFRISPSLAIIEAYTDNVYLAEDNEESDFYTEIAPGLTLDFALAPRNYITLKYLGNYFYFSEADNSDYNQHFGEASWSAETAKGSNFTLGTSISETSVQPYSARETAKDYSLNRVFGEMFLLPGSVTEIGLQYERLARRFDAEEFEVDDYDRDQFDVSILYRRSEILPLLLQYRLVLQDNEPEFGIDRDYKTHSIFTGARWRPAGKLSGALRVGYTWSDFDSDQIDEFSGLGMDIDLIYRITEITRLTLLGRRAILPRTRAERDSGNYYVLTSGGLRLSHHRWEKITTIFRYDYFHREYQSGLELTGEDRVDEEHVAGASIEYALRNWLSLIFGYQYRNRDSDREDVNYEENLFELGVRLLI